MQNGLNSPGPFTIFLVFSAGLLTSLGPCSLSLLPVTIAYIGGTEKNKFKLISFSGGVVFSLVALGAASGFLGKIYGQIPSYYTSFVALIAIIMGLNLLGILKFQFFHFIHLNFTHLIAKIASPGPVASVPTLGSWIEEDLGLVMTEKHKSLTTIKLASIKI